MEEKNNNGFKYTYTAPTEEERLEINSIRKQYSAVEGKEGKIERLRELDSRVKTPAMAVSLSLGIGGCLLFGLGLAVILEWDLFILGVILCVVGAIPTGLAYPIHNIILKRNKKKYGGEILRLSEELLNEYDEKS